MQPADVVTLIGNATLLHHGERPGPGDIVTLVTLPGRASRTEPANTIMLNFTDASRAQVETRTIDGSRRVTSTADCSGIMTGLRPGPAISKMITALAGVGHTFPQVPIFCATRHRDGWHVYSRTDLRPGQWCFIRTSATVVPATADSLCWLDTAITLHAANCGAINTRRCTMPPAFAGKEVETKYTLRADTAIWPLALDTHARLTAGDIPAMVPRFGVDFELHEFDNYLFDVSEPADQRGYVSFMSVQPGIYWIKHKRFTADALIRSETVSGEIRLDQPLDIYVRDVLQLRARLLPPFRRVRYDIMLESLVTGNHYFILFDRCTVHSNPEETLTQCEIEYLRSRRILPVDEALVLDEYQALTRWCAEYLADLGIITGTGYYSKLSFLRDVIRRSPDLQPDTSH